MPEIRKYQRKFNNEILCGSLWGVNLLIGRKQRGRIWEQRGGIWEQRGGIWEQRGGILEQRGGIWEHRGGIWEQRGGIWDEVASLGKFQLPNK